MLVLVLWTKLKDCSSGEGEGAGEEKVDSGNRAALVAGARSCMSIAGEMGGDWRDATDKEGD